MPLARPDTSDSNSDGIPSAEVTVALLGNPNTGKSSLFGALCGVRQRVANYSGVTVEEKRSEMEFAGRRFILVDLPGTYSLSARSQDEVVTVDALLGRLKGTAGPDVVLCVVNATNLSRNLYLVSQALDLGRPVVIALNMVDLARDLGLCQDVDRLSQRLGVPVIPTQAHRGVGIEELRRALNEAVVKPPPNPAAPFPDIFRHEEQALVETVRSRENPLELPRFLLQRLLLDRGGYLETAEPPIVDSQLLAAVDAARKRLDAAGCPVPAIEAISRYAWVEQVLEGCEQQPADRKPRFSDRLDALLMHKVWGTLFFTLLMVLVFQSIFAWASPLMSALDAAIGALGQWTTAHLPAGAFQSLVVDGIISGAGSVLTFLPQILVLFLFIAILEDCGYMARAAYLMDKLMARVGLSGKSFLPLLSSFACAVPGILAARVIEDRRDRLVTILVAPLMSCSARLPVYALLTAAFIPQVRFLGGWLSLQGLVMSSMYLLGILAAVIVALALKHTILPGRTPAFVMELPHYKFPSPRNVFGRVFDCGWSFVRQAGTLIVAVSVVIWAAAYFPRNEQVVLSVRAEYAGPLAQVDRQIRAVVSDRSAQEDAGREMLLAPLVMRQSQLEDKMANDIAAAQLEHSLLGQAGKLIVPVVRPLGWDWRIGCAVIASFSAREVVIGTLGVIYNLGQEQDERSESLQQTLQAATWPDSERPVFTVPVALSLMVFFALCAQCAATLAVIRRETNSWRWPIFTFTYMTVLAYVGALVTYQVGSWWTGG